MRLAGPADAYEKMVAEFSKNLGVAFQILNDLKDWDGDSDNKLIAGQDVLAARPTLLLALALEGSTPAEREELLALLHGQPRARPTPADVVDRVRAAVRRRRRSSTRPRSWSRSTAPAPRPSPTRSSRPSCANCSITWSITSSTANRRRRRSRRPSLIQLTSL